MMLLTEACGSINSAFWDSYRRPHCQTNILRANITYEADHDAPIAEVAEKAEHTGARCR